MRRIWLIAIIILASSSLSMGLGDTGYRTVSIMKEGGKIQERRMVVRRRQSPGGIEPSRILWQDLPSRILSLPLNPSAGGQGGQSDAPVFIADRELPPIEAKIEFSDPRPVSFPRRDVSARSFKIGGKIPREDAPPDEAATAALANVGARFVAIEGEGVAIFDAKSGSPLAGRLRIVRKITPALWRDASKEGGLTSEMEAAWSIIP
ncbi:MAG: hypothetical protein V2A66_07560 [Pseudomonadota bacterium]